MQGSGKRRCAEPVLLAEAYIGILDRLKMDIMLNPEFNEQDLNKRIAFAAALFLDGCRSFCSISWYARTCSRGSLIADRAFQIIEVWVTCNEYNDGRTDCKSYGEKILFKDASFGMADQDKIGVVGVNGTGKSTFCALLQVWSLRMRTDFHRQRCTRAVSGAESGF